MYVKLTRDEIHQTLTTNMQEWKINADIEDVQDLNDELTHDDISVICSSDFYDDLYDTSDQWNTLEKYFLDTELNYYSRESFILIHNVYNK